MLSNNQQLSPEDRAAHFLTRYIEAANLDLHLRRVDPPPVGNGSDTVLTFEFTGPDTPLLLERNADLLNSLEHLVAKLLGFNSEEHHRIRLDAAGFKSGRDQELNRLAKQAVADVLSSGHPFRLPPMNSRERRLIHLLIAPSGLRSASTGEGTFRSITVFPHTSAPPATGTQPAADPAAPNPETDARLARLRRSFGRR